MYSVELTGSESRGRNLLQQLSDFGTSSSALYSIRFNLGHLLQRASPRFHGTHPVHLISVKSDGKQNLFTTELDDIFFHRRLMHYVNETRTFPGHLTSTDILNAITLAER
jgi:hypothetical protein